MDFRREIERPGRAKETAAPDSTARRYTILIVLVVLGELAIAALIYRWISPPEEVVPENVPEAEQIQPKAVYDRLEKIVVNPAGSMGMRVLSIDLVLLLDSKGTIEEVDRRRTLVYDALRDVLTQREIDAFDEMEELSALKKDLTEAANRVLRKGRVVDVSIKNMVMQ